jgi:mRNA interferase MazF
VICDRFETIVVPFPFAERPIVKRRPVAVVSSRTFNATNGASLVAMITTAKETTWPADISLNDIEMAGLPLPCILRLRLVTLPNEMILRALGRLGPVDRLACEKGLAEMLVG